MIPSILPLLTFGAGWGFGAAIGASSFVRRALHLSPIAKNNGLVTKALGGVVLLIVAYTSIQTSQANKQATIVNQCQAQYNTQFRQAIAARSDANAIETRSNDAYLAAQQAYLQTVYRPGVSAVDRMAAGQRYLEALAIRRAALNNLDQTRDRTPIAADPGCGQ